MNCRILVVDDDTALQYTFREIFSRHGYDVKTTGDPFEALQLAPDYQPHIMVVDYSMPKMTGLELVTRLKEKQPSIVFVMITAYGSEKVAVEAMKAGVYDYFAKPFDNDEIVLVIDKARERLNLLEQTREYKQRLVEQISFVGQDPEMRKVMGVVEQVAGTDVTVLIQGESGTGKELVATAIHNRSDRAARPFIKLNCAALPENLVESELFGYESGAFTGAAGQRKGKFELANRGTIFLDEIGDMSLSTQTKVLRVLQEREIERLGGGKIISVDVRVIAATHQNLEAKIADGTFRDDLFYRLNVVTLRLPPLRSRRGDIEALAEHFLERHSEKFGRPRPDLTPDIVDAMKRYDWPGNVRELENSVARAVVLDDLSALVPASAGAAGGGRHGGGTTLEGLDLLGLLGKPYKEAKQELISAFDKEYFSRMLDGSGGNITRAAKNAGMHRKNFWQKVQAFQEAGDEPAPETEAGRSE